MTVSENKKTSFRGVPECSPLLINLCFFDKHQILRVFLRYRAAPDGLRDHAALIQRIATA